MHAYIHTGHAKVPRYVDESMQADSANDFFSLARWMDRCVHTYVFFLCMCVDVCMYVGITIFFHLQDGWIGEYIHMCFFLCMCVDVCMYVGESMKADCFCEMDG